MTVLSARLKVKAHGNKRFIIALKYEGEDNYRYLVTTDVSWRHDDIARLHTLRWLIEVFFEDWKLHEGWCNRVLSLLPDNVLCFRAKAICIIVQWGMAGPEGICDIGICANSPSNWCHQRSVQ